MKLRNLPIGKSSFESIREKNDLYVDKTRHIYQLASKGEYYFLSRPRRFGKSLTVSTLKCLFQGRKELFDGLWIADNTEWEWKVHPVVVLDFNEISHDSPENLRSSLQRTLQQIAEEYDTHSDSPLLENQFKELILSLYRKTAAPVVILIDEYDKPIIAHLGRGKEAFETAKANRDILKYFFGVIKGAAVSPALRLVFITGVSKFSRVSIFSELNNLNDLTMNRHYADMLGYTQSELENEFADYIGRFAEDGHQTREQIIEKMKAYYNGYRFSDKNVRVYNPFSVLKSLDEMAFKNYWFDTGTPTFLVNLLNDMNWYLPKIENLQATEAVFSTYELENLKPEALLFQTGYITIKDVADRLYIFDYPNQEVKTSFLEVLFHSYTQGLRDGSRFVLLSGYLYQENYERFFETMSSIFSSIPYTLETRRDEAYFHTVFYRMLCASGANARSEMITGDGRIDLVIEFPDKVYIIEFKCNQSAEAAIAQIQEKGYDNAFRQSGKKIILLGINFNSEKRKVEAWKVA